MPIQKEATKSADLTEVPQAVYGTSPQSAFCPVRVTTLRGIATNQIWLRWVLFLAQYRQLTLHNGDPGNDPMLLQYRSQVYHLIRRKLTSSSPLALSNEVFYGLLIAGISEDRVGDSRQANYHLEAGLKLLKARRESGLRPPNPTSTDLVFCSAYVGAGVQNYFSDSVALSSANRWVLQQLRAMQNWNWELRQSRYGSSRVSAMQNDANSSGNKNGAYLKARNAFNAKASRCFCQSSEWSTIFESRTYLGSLFALNTVLWACRSNESAAVDFITDVLCYWTKTETGAKPDGSVRFTPVTFLYIIAFCGSSLVEKHDSPQDCFNIWDVVKFVELMSLTTQETLAKVRETLVSWLLVSMEEPEGLVVLSVADEYAMTAEVEGIWSQKQSQLVVSSNMMRRGSTT